MVEPLFASPDVVCGVSTKPHNMSYLHGNCAHTRQERETFLSGMGIPLEKLVCPTQVHGAVIREVFPHDRGKGAFEAGSAFPATDGLITRSRQLPLGVFTADCLSIFLFAPRIPSVGIAHAGWRSTREGIIGKMVAYMRHQFGTKPDEIYAACGPCIRECCYEVGREFSGYFPAHVRESKGKYHFDLAGANCQQLLESGVRPENITDRRVCTSCDAAQYFSFRKEGAACGRMMSVIMLQ